MQDLTGKITGSTLTAVEWNQLPQEVQNVITAPGQTLTNADLNQLGKGIAQYVANGSFYTDSGAVNVYSLSAISGYQAPVAYVNGMIIAFLAANTNTGPSTVDVAGLGAKNIVNQHNGILSSGDISITQVNIAFYNLANDRFEKLELWPRAASETQRGAPRFATSIETNNGSLDNVAVSPLRLAGRTALESRTGIAEIATQTETNAGVDDTRIITPQKLFGWEDLVLQGDILTSTFNQGASVSVNLLQVDDLELDVWYRIDCFIQAQLDSAPTTETIELNITSVGAIDYSFLLESIAEANPVIVHGTNDTNIGGLGTLSDSTTDGWAKISGVFKSDGASNNLNIVSTTNGIAATFRYAYLQVHKLNDTF